jgi:hypothetical protein
METAISAITQMFKVAGRVRMQLLCQDMAQDMDSKVDTSGSILSLWAAKGDVSSYQYGIQSISSLVTILDRPKSPSHASL